MIPVTGRHQSAPFFTKGVSRLLSPFSIHYNWTFRPASQTDQEPGNAPIRYLREAEALKAIGRIGIIGSVQIGRLFGFQRRHIRRMLHDKKLVQHTLIKNKNPIPVFTLGPRAAKLLNMPEPDTRTWSTERILKSLVFFQFCCALNDKQKAFQIHASPHPFTGKIQIENETRSVLVLRGKNDGLDDFLRHQSRVIIIAESLEQAQPFGELISGAVLLLDEDLKGDYRFYRWHNGRWVR